MRIWLTREGVATNGRGYDPEALTWRTTTPVVSDGEVVGMATIERAERDGEVWLAADIVSDDDLSRATFDLDVDAAVERFEAGAEPGHWIESGVIRRLVVTGEQSEAQAEAADVLATLDSDFQTDGEGPEGLAVEGVIVVEGTPTGDDRLIEPGALTWDTLPIPIIWDREEGDHTAMTVGRVDAIERRDNGEIWATGVLSESEDEETQAAVLRVAELLEEGAVGVSVSLDSESAEIRVSAEAVEREEEAIDAIEDGEVPEVETDDEGNVIVARWEAGEEMYVVTSARIRHVAVVDTPAFAEAKLTLVAGSYAVPGGSTGYLVQAERTITAAVVGDTGLPVADRDRDWDGSAATTRVFDFYTDEDGNVDTEGVAKAFILRDDDADPTTQAAYSLGFADIIDDTLTIVPAGVAATAGGRGLSAVEDISDDERERAAARICALYDRLQDEFEDWPDCPFADDDEASIQAHAAAATMDFDPPPADWFSMAEPSEDDERVVWVNDEGAPCDPADETARPWGVPLTVTAEGQVYGHLASWQDCHTGYEDRCLTPPRSASGYAWFHTGQTDTSDGPVPTGRITVDTSHAPHRMSAASAVAHYDQTGHAVADVHVVDGELGPWMTGWVRPWATQQQRHELVAHPPSGDWRPRGGSTELIGVLAVNVAGFPMPRSVATYRSGEFASLVASGFTPRAEGDDRDEVMDRIARLEARLEAGDVLRQLESV